MTQKKLINEDLKPKIETQGTEIDAKDLKVIAKDLQNTIQPQASDESSDSFFRAVINKLFDEENISAKTEYLNVTENFVGSKLEFFASFGNMPYLKNFINIFETKRISLERKGRKEILMGLQERRQELEAQRSENLRSMFNV